MVSFLPPLERTVWGTTTWSLLHIVAARYPEHPTDAQRTAAQQLFTSLATLLPCTLCQGHYRGLLAETPPAVSSRTDLEHWLWTVHNRVNERLGHPVVSLAQCQQRWRNLSMQQYGPYVWRAIHFLAFLAPERLSADQTQQFVIFFSALVVLMPGEHFRYACKVHPLRLTTSTRAELANWTVEIHRLVSMRLLKGDASDMTYAMAERIYTSVIAPCSNGRDGRDGRDGQAPSRPGILWW